MTPVRPVCVVTSPGFDLEDEATAGRLIQAGLNIRISPNDGYRTTDELFELMLDATAAIVSTDRFDSEALARLRQLRVIARTGTGTDSIDVDAATASGIAIATTRDTHSETVADHTLALILVLIRRVVEHDRSVRSGEWNRGGDLTAGELFGKTVGLIGYGKIGRAVARRLQGFNCRLLIHDPAVCPPIAGEIVPLDSLLGMSDVVSLHTPLTDRTRGLIGEHEMNLLRPDAILINTARGGLLDEDALVAQLRNRRLAAAALDVFAEEPVSVDAFEGLNNVVLTPHIAGLSTASIRRLATDAVTAVLDVLDGRATPAVINPGALKHPRHHRHAR